VPWGEVQGGGGRVGLFAESVGGKIKGGECGPQFIKRSSCNYPLSRKGKEFWLKRAHLANEGGLVIRNL